MKIKLTDQHGLIAFDYYINEVAKILVSSKGKLDARKDLIKLIETNVMLLELKDLICKTAIKKAQMQHSITIKKATTIKISPMQGYTIIAFLPEYERSGGNKYGDYVAFFIQQLKDKICKELLTN
ncbi:MAG TPA: hypothetical protein VGC65_00270 [Bacteroidia bacterium]|jgi:hypothetical protein